MQKGYFHRVEEQSPTMFWINNPTRAEVDMAIEAGALGCTCNPAYLGKMIDVPSEREWLLPFLDDALRQTEDDGEVEAVVQRQAVKFIQEKFLPMHQKSKGKHGYVSIQGDPIREHDWQVILHEAHENRKLGPNACIKVPTTEAGLKVMEVLFSEDTPVNATEVFAVRQGLDVIELYERVTKKTGKYPQLYVSHIAGIYDEHLAEYAKREGVDISPDVLWQAGLAAARKMYKLMEERKTKAILVGGGARGLHHFTEMVGGRAVVTINWVGTADKLIESNPPVMYRLFNPVPQKVIDELVEKLPDFRKGYLDDGLKPEDYEEFGPVVRFRDSFVKNWKKFLEVAKQRRKML
jgi:transaldolase